jgi:hypothetical protein
MNRPEPGNLENQIERAANSPPDGRLWSPLSKSPFPTGSLSEFHQPSQQYRFSSRLSTTEKNRYEARKRMPLDRARLPRRGGAARLLTT